MIFTISASLFFILLFSFKLFKGNITRPSFIFTSGMFLASLLACLFAKEWELLVMDWKTQFMIIGGSVLALVTDYSSCNPSKSNFGKKKGVTFTMISEKRLLIFAIIQFIAYVLYLKSKVANVGAAYAIAEAIGEINEMSKFDDTFKLYIPWYFNVPYAFFQAYGYIWAILMPIYLNIGKVTTKAKVLAFVNYLLAILGCMIQGGRMPMLNYIVPCFMSYILISIYVNRGKAQIKKYFLIIFFAVLFLALFQQIGSLIGRGELDTNGLEVIAEYCGAEIKNLDTVISNPPRIKAVELFPMTFMRIYNNLAVSFGTSPSSIDFNTIYEFQFCNGYHLGNVYTCYANYYLDLGLFGLLFVFIAIWLTTKFYSKANFQVLFQKGIPNVWCFLYAEFIGLLFLAFFHEQYYAINPVSLIRGIIYIYIGYLFLFPRNIKFNYFK